MDAKVVVKGGTGSGKTRLARTLADRLGVPHIELDALHHGPNWAEPSGEEFRRRVEAALAARPGWVVDGNYDSKLGDLVVGQADTIVWLDLPLRVTFPRLWRRTLHRIRNDVELWGGKRETWRSQLASRHSIFVWTIRAHVRHRRRWPAGFGGDPRLVRLRSDAEARRWLDEQTAG